MEDLTMEETEKALALLHEARKLLFEQLHERNRATKELAEGVDRLSRAFDLLERPDEQLCLCPACQRQSFGAPRSGQSECLTRGEERRTSTQIKGGDDHGQTKNKASP